MLTLEIGYRTDGSSPAVFADASRANEAKTVHLRFAALLDEAGKNEVSSRYTPRTHLTLTRFPSHSSELRKRTNVLSRSSESVPKSGPYLANTTAGMEKWRRRGLVSRVDDADSPKVRSRSVAQSRGCVC